MSFKINKNIPMPTSLSKYPFADMAIGDSFVGQVNFDEKKSTNIRNAASVFGRSQNPVQKFTCKKVKGQLVIWRTK